MDLALNNQQMLIGHKTQQTNQPTNQQMISYRIWTHVAVSISIGDDRYVLRTFKMNVYTINFFTHPEMNECVKLLGLVLVWFDFFI